MLGLRLFTTEDGIPFLKRSKTSLHVIYLASGNWFASVFYIVSINLRWYVQTILFQARCGLQHLKVNFPCHSAFREHTMKTINFEQFSMAFACYVFQHFKSGSYSPCLSSLDDSENSNAALRLTCGILRHARSLCAPRDENWTQRVLRPRTSTGSFDPNNNVSPGVEHPPRRRRLPLSMSFGEQNEFIENNSPNRQLGVFKVSHDLLSPCDLRPLFDYCDHHYQQVAIRLDATGIMLLNLKSIWKTAI